MKFYFRIFSSIFLLFLCSCAFDVEDDQRLFVTGTLVDENQNPVPDISIYSSVRGYQLGAGKSDASGKFGFTSLESYQGEFEIYINYSSYNESTLTSVYYSNTAYNRERNKDEYDLGEIVIRQKAELDFKVVKTSTEEKNLEWSILITTPHCQYNYYNNYLLEKRSSCYPQRYFLNTQTSDNPDKRSVFSTLKNTTAELIYQIDDEPEQTTVINLNELNNSYVLEY